MKIRNMPVKKVSTIIAVCIVLVSPDLIKDNLSQRRPFDVFKRTSEIHQLSDISKAMEENRKTKIYYQDWIFDTDQVYGEFNSAQAGLVLLELHENEYIPALIDLDEINDLKKDSYIDGLLILKDSDSISSSLGNGINNLITMKLDENVDAELYYDFVLNSYDTSDLYKNIITFALSILITLASSIYLVVIIIHYLKNRKKDKGI